MITLSASAGEKIKELIEQKGEEFALRIFIKSGGCGGFSYGLALDTKKDYDMIEEQYGIKILIDSDNEKLLAGAEIDFVDDRSGTGFKISNPTITSTCGCGAGPHTHETHENKSNI